MRRSLLLVLAIAAVTLAGCNSRSLSLDLTPNPLIVGLLDTQATVHAHAVAHGFAKVPIGSVQFAVFNAAASMLASQTEPVNQNIPSSPFGIAVDKDFTFPINGALVALSGTKYVVVKILDPTGNELTEKRLDIVVHALKGVSVPNVFKPAPTSPAPSPSH